MPTITKTKRPRIKPLPVHTSTVEYRIKKHKEQLGITPNMSHDDRMAQIRREWANL
jgi:hypothetical protein